MSKCGQGRSRGRRWRILRLVFRISVRNSAYNQFTLPALDQHDITLCSLVPSELVVDPSIKVFEGDGTARGFLRALGRALEADEYDLVHAHSPHVGFLFLLAALMRRRTWALACKSVYTVGNSYANLKARNRLMLLMVFAGFTRIVCCSRASFDSCSRVARWLAGARLGHISNGVYLERVDRALAGIEASAGSPEFTIAVVGRLEAIKQPEVLLDAFLRVRDERSRLIFIGDGPLREGLAERVRAQGLGARVRFAGLVTREAVYRMVVGADVMVSASRGEGLPIAVLEAMACRCPVILSDIAPHREVVANIKDVPLIAWDDVDGFARALTRLQSMSRVERLALGTRCRQHVERHFDLAKSLQQYDEVYAQVCGRAAGDQA